MSVSVILVHYHTPSLVEEALAALTADAAGASIDLECLLVDNGSTVEDRHSFRRLSCRYLRATDEAGRPANLGYAGGVNLGVAAATGEVIVVMNPDVFVRRGCLHALCEALRTGACVVGPRFYLDRTCKVFQPPADHRSRWQDLRTVLAQAGIGAGSARRRWRRDAHRVWTASSMVPCAQLSGALLAFRRGTWEQVGPFDTGYKLYFEETDWLVRVRRGGGRVALVPTARATHLYAQSTLAEPRAAAWFEESARRFRRRWYGGVYTALVERSSRALTRRRERWQGQTAALREWTPTDPPHVPNAGWLELSLDRCGVPAAGIALVSELGAADLAFVKELLAQLGAGVYSLRFVDHQGRDLEVQRFELQKRSESPMV